MFRPGMTKKRSNKETNEQTTANSTELCIDKMCKVNVHDCIPNVWWFCVIAKTHW